MDIEISNSQVDIAASAAIKTWAGSEGEMSKNLRQSKTITEDFLRGWLSLWMLARSNPKLHREQLATFLTKVARPAILSTEEDLLPACITKLTKDMKASGASRGLQTSLMSKFAFSLRPEVIVPYDRRARIGLGKLFAKRIREHDYVAYLSTFHEYSDHVSLFLDSTGKTDAFRTQWECVMSERLFKVRTADKYFMLLGGFSEKKMKA